MKIAFSNLHSVILRSYDVYFSLFYKSRHTDERMLGRKRSSKLLA